MQEFQNSKNNPKTIKTISGMGKKLVSFTVCLSQKMADEFFIPNHLVELFSTVHVLLSRFFKNLLYPNYIQILSQFNPEFILKISQSPKKPIKV